MSVVKLITGTALAVTVWVAFVVYSGLNGMWMSAIVAPDDAGGFAQYAASALRQNNKGNSAFVLIEAGQIVSQFHTSADDSVNSNTMFAAASMSKWFAAYAMMKLVEDGRADLDVPVSRYLTRWQLPASEFGNDGVTIRRLLSHTAGFSDGLGFGDYDVQERLPSLEEELSHPRASSGRQVVISVTEEPGTLWKYSGASYLLLELLIEEISELPFERYIDEVIFAPLGMSNAGYKPLDSYENNAGSYDLEGVRTSGYKYASSAATGLVVSSADLTRFLLSQIQATEVQGSLKDATLTKMREPHGRNSGFDIWGLGTILYAPTANGDFVFGHDGANDPAINTTARINPDTGDALIVLVTGHPALATRIGSEWVLWQTGIPDVLAAGAVVDSMLLPGILGSVLILLLALMMGYRIRTRQLTGEV
ncbi:MAG: beta-lactamase family protein [Pseudomonadaceae bacterium]|nr:beta-lactamase family protein [Pseudomonadaceae bacterium]